jgi:hypothetical protein
MVPDFEILESETAVYRLYNPVGFDPRHFLPEELWKHSDSVRYLIHTILHQRLMYHRRRNDFIELKAAYLNGFFSPKEIFPAIRQHLIDCKLIECDHWYIKARKSYGYRLGSMLKDLKFTSIYITDPKLVNKLRAKAEERQATLTDTHLYLKSWVERLDFNYEGALRLLTKSGIHEEMCSLERLRDKDFFFVVCPYGRVHTNITNLRSKLRRFLSFNGQQLINLDIRNSQPLIFSIVLINYLINNKALDSLNNWSLDVDGYYDLQSLQLSVRNNNYSQPPTLSNTSPLRFRNLIREDEDREGWKDTTVRLMALGLSEDALEYIDLVQKGKLYEFMMGQTGLSASKRSTFKRKFFKKVFFCKNEPVSMQAEIFQRCFPNVYEAVYELKRRDYCKLAHILQKTESSLIINRIARRCMEELPDTCIVTIHDSIMTTPDAADHVRNIMREEFLLVGLDPTINVQ